MIKLPQWENFEEFLSESCARKTFGPGAEGGGTHAHAPRRRALRGISIFPVSCPRYVIGGHKEAAPARPARAPHPAGWETADTITALSVGAFASIERKSEQVKRVGRNSGGHRHPAAASVFHLPRRPRGVVVVHNEPAVIQILNTAGFPRRKTLHEPLSVSAPRAARATCKSKTNSGVKTTPLHGTVYVRYSNISILCVIGNLAGEGRAPRRRRGNARQGDDSRRNPVILVTG
ncbi:hypothetical protein EVAR_60867_1 [Eumeta japonica]|uniref:Uncharacterized protein n=1 Tax=Eumeta variegata TaxID=151549 RepID=A0A4C1Y4Z5_EUMVA|nr:hypothetical protein EVAR_60867_1 [Eumeta japonica]